MLNMHSVMEGMELFKGESEGKICSEGLLEVKGGWQKVVHSGHTLVRFVLLLASERCPCIST